MRTWCGDGATLKFAHAWSVIVCPRLFCPLKQKMRTWMHLEDEFVSQLMEDVRSQDVRAKRRRLMSTGDIRP